MTAERALIGLPPFRDMAVYHWQQPADKALKAFLTWHNRPFPKSHDLPQLVQECHAIDAGFAQLDTAAYVLNPCATQFRYPGIAGEPTQQATDDARQHARDVVEFVKARLPQNTWP